MRIYGYMYSEMCSESTRLCIRVQRGRGGVKAGIHMHFLVFDRSLAFSTTAKWIAAQTVGSH